MSNELSERFRAAPRSAVAWGVYDELAKCWAVEPKVGYLRPAAEDQADRMNAAQRGGGHS